MYCTNCGSLLKEEALFCGNCGTKRKAPSPKKTKERKEKTMIKPQKQVEPIIEIIKEEPLKSKKSNQVVLGIVAGTMICIPTLIWLFSLVIS